MDLNTILLIIVIVLLVLLLIIIIVPVIFVRRNKNNNNSVNINSDGNDLLKVLNEKNMYHEQAIFSKLDSEFKVIKENNESLFKNINNSLDSYKNQISDLNNLTNKSVSESNVNLVNNLNQNFENYKQQVKEIKDDINNSLVNIQNNLKENINKLNSDNQSKLDEIKGVVDTKLEETLNKKLDQSIKDFNDNLTKVFEAVGKMQDIGSSVNKLTATLNNVKQTGNLGEYTLRNILLDMFSPNLYVENFEVSKGNTVEFAIKYPTIDKSEIYTAIDSKFHYDTFSKLQEAYIKVDKDQIEFYKKEFKTKLNKDVKDVSEKYIKTPLTTDFAIIYLPSEAMYVEAVNQGLFEEYKIKHNVMLTGPSTIAALLSSLSIAFRNLTLQEKSQEILKLLQNVKKSFTEYNKTLEKTITYVDNASDNLHNLVGPKTKKIVKSLQNVYSSGEDEAEQIEEKNNEIKD